MKSIVFSPEAAELLNGKVASKIAPHLFLVCNYEPEQILLFGTDAKFVQGGLNLYRFVIDASIIHEIDKIAKKCNIGYDRSLKDYIRDISIIRTAFSHNLSQKNGTGYQQEAYNEWLKRAINKDQIMAAEDYEKALEKLEKMGADIYRILDRFLDKAAGVQDKNALISVWEETIISFYLKKSNENIFLGQMRDAYLSRCVNGKIEKKNLKYNIAKWFQSFFCQKHEDRIKELENILRLYGSRMRKDDILKVEKDIDLHKSSLDAIKTQVATAICYGDQSRVSVYAYQQYYLANLKDKLNNILSVVKCTNGTMLPEDMLQQLIEEEFKGIRGEDFPT